MKARALSIRVFAFLCAFSFAGTSIAAAATSVRRLAVRTVRAQLVITGEVTGGTAYVGCTITDKDGREHHFRPKSASGRFSTSFTGWHASQEWDWVVAVWGKKTYKKECKNGPRGGPCEWCDKNGYHLENRLDRASGQYTPPPTLAKHIRWIRGVLSRAVSRTRSTFSSSARQIRSSKKDEATRKRLAKSIKATLDTIKDELEKTAVKTKEKLKAQFKTSAAERTEILNNLRNIRWLTTRIGETTAKALEEAGKGPAAWLAFADWLSRQPVDPPY